MGEVLRLAPSNRAPLQTTFGSLSSLLSFICHVCFVVTVMKYRVCLSAEQRATLKKKVSSGSWPALARKIREWPV